MDIHLGTIQNPDRQYFHINLKIGQCQFPNLPFQVDINLKKHYYFTIIFTAVSSLCSLTDQTGQPPRCLFVCFRIQSPSAGIIGSQGKFQGLCCMYPPFYLSQVRMVSRNLCKTSGLIYGNQQLMSASRHWASKLVVEPCWTHTAHTHMVWWVSGYRK